MIEEGAKLLISGLAILALAGFARWLKLGSDVRIRDEAHALALAREAVSGFEAVVSEADAGIVTTSVPTLEVAVMTRRPSGMSSDSVTPVAGDGPSFLAVME